MAAMHVDGLDLDVGVALRMILTLVNPTDEFVGYYLYFNGDYVNDHYWCQFLRADDEAVTSGRRNDPGLIGLDPGESALVTATLARCPDGLVRATVSGNRGDPAEVIFIDNKIVWTVPENVTRIAVKADAPVGMGPGSTLVVHDTGAIRD